MVNAREFRLNTHVLYATKETIKKSFSSEEINSWSSWRSEEINKYCSFVKSFDCSFGCLTLWLCILCVMMHLG
jgi:hypothetical protein